MAMTQIIGQVGDQDDGDPVELRVTSLQLQGGGNAAYSGLFAAYLDGLPGFGGSYPAYSPIYNDAQPGIGTAYWQYYPNGIVACGPAGCACIVYGPIFEYYDGVGQFQGPLGFPTGDTTILPGEGSYSVFENGVLYADSSGNVTQMSPLSPTLVQGFSVSSQFPSGINPTVAGITQLAGVYVQQFADNALANNAQLAQEVNSINTTTTFVQVGPRTACTNSSVAVGTLKPYTFNLGIHCNLSGCASIFGSANASVDVEITFEVTGQGMQAVMSSYTIESLGTPFGQGLERFQSSLDSAFSSLYGQALISMPFPRDATVVAVIVDDSGNLDIYIAPLCAATKALAFESGRNYPANEPDPSLFDSVQALRMFRDGFLRRQRHGEQVIRLIDDFGAICWYMLQRQPDSAQLTETVAIILGQVDADSEGVQSAFTRMATQLVDLQRLAEGKEGPPAYRILVEGLAWLRSRVGLRPYATEAIRELTRLIEEEARGFRDGSASGQA